MSLDSILNNVGNVFDNANRFCTQTVHRASRLLDLTSNPRVNTIIKVALVGALVLLGVYLAPVKLTGILTIKLMAMLLAMVAYAKGPEIYNFVSSSIRGIKKTEVSSTEVA